ncbi:MAG: hypothetical protein HUJ22_07450 [Gracilimonas sp.]|uniref:hypothetical protein n=1 Tax=Gracilimonas sp. TaxID=1974203 RepID=UPI0019B16CB0|nr:hypothetical protein [Gracilimonas sp.]MBD3616392.1 hypothetical protein [Gracilimonas sp.]
MKPILLVTVPLLYLFTSCTATSNQYLASEYQEPEQRATISILPIQAEVFFEYFPGYAFGKLENDQDGTFEQYLPSFIERNTQADVKEILTAPHLEGENFELKELPLKSGDTFQILAPKENTSLTSPEINTRFTLILDQFNYQMYSIETGGGNYAGHEMETETRLKFETKYLIWDNQAGQPAAWGKVNSVKRYTVLERKMLFQQLLDEVFEQILSKSPFS